MVQNIEEKLKTFKKRLKEFKKVAQRDKEESLPLAKDLIEDCELFIKRTDLKLKDKTREDIVKTKESLELYVQQISQLIKFDKKWS